MLQPLRQGVALVDQARPIAEVLKEISTVLTEARAARTGFETPDTGDGTDSE